MQYAQYPRKYQNQNYSNQNYRKGTDNSRGSAKFVSTKKMVVY